MTSAARVWIVIAALACVTAAPKLVATSTPPTMASDRLADFVAQQADAPPASVTGRTGLTGWTFVRKGCPMQLFRLLPNGSQDEVVRRHAGPADRVAYVYQGRVTAQPPTARVTVGHVLYRARARLGLQTEAPGYFALIHPRSCPALAALDWTRL